jgi:pimeloyl-ACP methyl ester carboxylesterase
MPSVLARRHRGELSYLRGGDGVPLVLLHGLPGSAHTWKRTGTLLAAHYDIIVPDLAGFGASDGLDELGLHLDHDFYLEAHAEAVHRLLCDLDVSSLYLGGHDLGGAVALTLHRLFPDLELKGLLLSATNLFTDPPVPLPLRLASVPVLGPVGLWMMTGTRMGLRLLYRAAACNRSAFRAVDFAEHLTASGVRQTRRLFRRSLTDPGGTYRDVEALLPSLDVPTLVLWGDRDPLLDVALARRLVETLPDASLSIFEDTGHFVPEERPELTAWHIDDFLRARSAPEPRSNHERSSF